MSRYPEPLEVVISFLRRLPGVGQKTSERFAFQLMQWDHTLLHGFSKSLRSLAEHLIECSECHCIKEVNGPCEFCTPSDQTSVALCVVAHPKDAFTIQNAHVFNGSFHSLGGLLSPLDGVGVSTLHIDTLEKRIVEHGIKEVVLALDSTLEGDATSLYLEQQLSPLGVLVSRLAFGVPIGSPLEYVDETTLARAIKSRQPIRTTK